MDVPAELNTSSISSPRLRVNIFAGGIYGEGQDEGELATRSLCSLRSLRSFAANPFVSRHGSRPPAEFRPLPNLQPSSPASVTPAASKIVAGGRAKCNAATPPEPSSSNSPPRRRWQKGASKRAMTYPKQASDRTGNLSPIASAKEDLSSDDFPAIGARTCKCAMTAP